MKQTLILLGTITALASVTVSGCTTAAKPGVAALTENVQTADAEGDGVGVSAYAGPTADGGGTRSAMPFRGNSRERECLMRAMYFESIRSSPEGLLSVGTVVMNRVESPKFPDTVCGVVGQKKQFAPGVLSRKMQGNTADLEALAEEILAGKRHPKAHAEVMFFHQAGLKFPYKNMRYTHVAGGNSFYYKAPRRR